MTSRLRVLCFAALVSLVRLAEAIGPVIRCEPCDVVSVSKCNPLPKECADKIREPGCGCCMTCALTEGKFCGIYTRRCGAGLKCQHRSGETRPLLALLEGRGICSSSTSQNRSGIRANGEDNTTDEDHGSNDQGPLDRDGRPRETNPRVTEPHPKTEVIGKDQSKKWQGHKFKPLSEGVAMDMQNLSFESKQRTEYGPCRREMESVLNSFKITAVINPQGFHIPNCDKKGFYKKKQCRPSKGRRRGFCWCVDKYGKPLLGLDGKERGDAQCYNLENQ